MFTSEGTFVDQNGDPVNGTVFLGRGIDPLSARAVSDLRTDRVDSPVALERHAVDRLTAPRELTETHVSHPSTSGRAGFTLIEALVAMMVLTVGLLGLAQSFYVGMRHMSTSSANLIAREKAREAVESVHTARDTRTITWDQIRNVSNGGVFLDGAQPLQNAGDDGLVNTADDAAAGIESRA